MATILDLVNFHRFKQLEKMQSLFFLITTMFQMRINKKINFNKHSARKYIRAYTIIFQSKALSNQLTTRIFDRKSCFTDPFEGDSIYSGASLTLQCFESSSA